MAASAPDPNAEGDTEPGRLGVRPASGGLESTHAWSLSRQHQQPGPQVAEAASAGGLCEAELDGELVVEAEWFCDALRRNDVQLAETARRLAQQDRARAGLPLVVVS